MTSPEAMYPWGTEPLRRMAATAGYAEAALLTLSGGRPTLTGLASSHPPPSRKEAGVAAAQGRSRRGSAPLVSAEELAILRHVAEGLPMDSVAQRVGTSPRTVRRRMRNLCDRIGATCAIQAVV